MNVYDHKWSEWKLLFNIFTDLFTLNYVITSAFTLIISRFSKFTKFCGNVEIPQQQVNCTAWLEIPWPCGKLWAQVIILLSYYKHYRVHCAHWAQCTLSAQLMTKQKTLDAKCCCNRQSSMASAANNGLTLVALVKLFLKPTCIRESGLVTECFVTSAHLNITQLQQYFTD